MQHVPQGHPVVLAVAGGQVRRVRGDRTQTALHQRGEGVRILFDAGGRDAGSRGGREQFAHATADIEH